MASMEGPCRLFRQLPYPPLSLPLLPVLFSLCFFPFEMDGAPSVFSFSLFLLSLATFRSGWRVRKARFDYRGGVVGDVRHAGQERAGREPLRTVQEHPGVPAVRQGEEIR